MVVTSCLEDLEGIMTLKKDVEVSSTGGEKEERMSGGEQ